MSETALTLIILLSLAGLGIISHNHAVTIAIGMLIILRITPLQTLFPWLEQYGLWLGIIILTIAAMLPIANGKLTPSMILHAFLEWRTAIAIMVGIVVSWLGSRGVTLMVNQPNMVAGLLIGTILGVSLFKGIAVGPLIAAGILSLLIGKE